MSTKQDIPAGYRQDAKGRLIPEAMISDIDKARDALVLELTAAAQALNKQMAATKQRVFGDVHAFVAMSAERFDTKLGGKKGNITLYSFDGQFKVIVATAENMVFDERLQAARALIDECISEWSADSRPEIQVLINAAFETDKAGNLNTGRILALRRYSIDDERWKRAMTAISESVQVIGSKQYCRFYQRRGDTDQYDPIPLDIAVV